MRFGRGHPLHSMHPRFVFHRGVNRLAREGNGHILHPSHGARAEVDNLGFPAAFLGIAQVHLQDLGRKQTGFVAARPCANLEDDVLLVIWVFRDQQNLELLLELVPTFFEPGQLLPSQSLQLRPVGPGEQLLDVSQVRNHLLIVSEGIDQLLQRGALPGNFLELGGVRQYLRIRKVRGEAIEAARHLFQFFNHCSLLYGRISL